MKEKEIKSIPTFYGKPEILMFWCETPVHPGVGVAIATGVDLPIQREVYTGYPRIQSSEIRGLLRSYVKYKAKDLEEVLFGSRPEAITLKAGNLTITDARLLLFPVSCEPGLFVWVTSPLLLHRFAQALRRKNEDIRELEKMLVSLKGNLSRALEGKVYLLGDVEINVGKIDDKYWKLIEKYLSKVIPNTPEYTYLRYRLLKEGYILIVSDDLLRELTERGTEQVTRIRLEYETKTVKAGGLWTEEYLPEYTVLYAEIYMSTRVKGEIEKKNVEESYDRLVRILKDVKLFIAGKETIGRGLIHIHVYGTEYGGSNCE